MENRGLATNPWLFEQYFLYYTAALNSWGNLELDDVLDLFLRTTKKVMQVNPLEMVMHFTS